MNTSRNSDRFQECLSNLQDRSPKLSGVQVRDDKYTPRNNYSRESWGR